MYIIILHVLAQFLLGDVVVFANDENNNPLFNLDHTMLEKNIAAIFNKVAHSSVTTKRSVPNFEVQLPLETTAATLPVPSVTTASSKFYSNTQRTPSAPSIHQGSPSPSSSRSLFTPPLPPEYSNPFADKPTLRGANDFVSNKRLPAQEDIPDPIRLPDTIKSSVQPTENIKFISQDESYFKTDSNKDSEKSKHRPLDSVPTLHITSISRILSGSSGKRQDIPEVLFKPLAAEDPPPDVPSLDVGRTNVDKTTLTSDVSIKIEPPNEVVGNGAVKNNNVGEVPRASGKNESRDDEKPSSKDPVDATPTKPTKPSTNTSPPEEKQRQNQTLKPFIYKLGYAWRIAWLLHIYLAATLFTFLALYSLYKIVKLSPVYSNQTYFLGIYLLLTLISILRCFYLLYDAYNFSSSLPESISNLLTFLPSGFLCCAFSMLFSFLSYNATNSVMNHKNLPLKVLVLSYIVNIVCVIILLISFDALSTRINVSTLLCQCIYVMTFLFIGFIYIYIQYATKIHLNNFNIQAICDRVHQRSTLTNFNSTLNACNAIALLFILMGLIKFYGVLFTINTLKTYTWLWYGWQCSVRLLELSICGLLVYSCCLSKQYLNDKELESKYSSRFAKFACDNTISADNTSKSLTSRTICCPSDTIKSYHVNRSDRQQTCNDNYPLNTFRNVHSNTLNLGDGHGSKRFHRKIQFIHDAESLNDIRDIRNKNIVTYNRANENFHTQRNLIACPSTSGSNMLVDENGFVRFKRIEKPDKELPNSYNTITLYDNSDQNCSLLELGTNHRNQYKIYNT